MTIKLDVLLVQIIHIVLLFWIFRKLIGNSLAHALLERKNKVERLEHADAEYERILVEAQEAADAAIKAGVQRKEEIIAEAINIAKKREDEILLLAEKQAKAIQDAAVQKTLDIEKELKEGFIDGVKRTTKLVVNKLIKDDVALQNSYIDGLVNEFVGEKKTK
jgi:F0F1-type ATP synthase membrane subunit b/b'